MKNKLLIAAFLFVSSIAEAGYFYSGNDLAAWRVEFQKAENKDVSANFNDAFKFRSYVIGVHDTGSGILFCPPKETSEIQIPAIAAKYIENHPEQWGKPGAEIVVMALSQAFPCPKKRP